MSFELSKCLLGLIGEFGVKFRVCTCVLGLLLYDLCLLAFMTAVQNVKSKHANLCSQDFIFMPKQLVIAFR